MYLLVMMFRPPLRFESGRNCRWPVASITVSGRRSGFEFLAILRERNEPGVSPIGTVARLPAEYSDSIAGQHRLGFLPADPIQHDGRIAFKFPIGLPPGSLRSRRMARNSNPDLLPE